MTFKIISAISLAVFATSTFAVDPPTTVNGGTVHFTGELVNAACAVSTESEDQTVRLGQYRTSLLATSGDTTGKIPFTIKLVDCDTTIQETASVAFYGQTVTSNANLLAVSAGGTNAVAATNVGIQVADDQDTILGFSGASFSNPKTLIDGTNILSFSARYVATGASTAGLANADATFVVHYE